MRPFTSAGIIILLHLYILVASKYFNIINRITWQREKGRGALSNWKNTSKTYWFCIKSGKDYKFHVDKGERKEKGHCSLQGRWKTKRLGRN